MINTDSPSKSKSSEDSYEILVKDDCLKDEPQLKDDSKQKKDAYDWSQDLKSITIKIPFPNQNIQNFDIFLSDVVLKINIRKKNIVKILDLKEQILFESPENKTLYKDNILECTLFKKEQKMWENLLETLLPKQQLAQRRNKSIQEAEAFEVAKIAAKEKQEQIRKENLKKLEEMQKKKENIQEEPLENVKIDSEKIYDAIGLIQFWGISPNFDFIDQKFDQQTVNVLLSGTSDIRHILKTCADHQDKDNGFQNMNIYMHEKQKELLCRNLLFLSIIHCTTISARERMELYMDIYGNMLIREKSQNYIDMIVPELIKLLTDFKKCKLAFKEILDFSEIKFKEIDEIVDVFQSWKSNIPYDIEQLRDQRLRYLHKHRYDYRINQADWDYQMNLKNEAPIIHWIHYKYWRQTGVAFEQRFSTYIIPNRTLSSWMPGKKKTDRTSCLVKGFWGDIMISPHIAFGTETDYEPEKMLLFKYANQQYVSNSFVVSEFNLQHQIMKIESNQEHRCELPEFWKGTEWDKSGKKKEPKKKDQMDDVKEEDENENDEEEELKQKSDINALKITNTENDIYQFNQVLDGFKKMNIKIIPTFEDISKMSTRKKFQNSFDISMIGFYHSGLLQKPELSTLLSKKSVMFVETTKFLVPVRKDDRVQFDKKLIQLGENMQMTKMEIEKQHHLRFFKS